MALDTQKFIDQLIENGYTQLCVVPCSFAKDLINGVINHPLIEYIPCASEAVACSVAAGLKMAGKKPMVIVQSSGVTNMGSCITSLLKPYGVTFPILTSWRTYKEGDSEIQHQHLASELPRLIEAYGYAHTLLDKNNIEKALEQINVCDTTHTLCIIQKESFTPVDLNKNDLLDLSHYTPRSEFLKVLNDTFKNKETLFIGTTGNTAREMYSFMKDTHNFYMAGNMGGALSLGLGASKAGKSVIVCGGDAEFVMHMGGLTTAGRYKEEIDLTYIVFDNESNKSTGGQNTYQTHMDYIKIAQASNFDTVNHTIISLKDFSNTLLELSSQKGLKFLHVKCGTDEETPRPPIEVVKVSHF